MHAWRFDTEREYGTDHKRQTPSDLIDNSVSVNDIDEADVNMNWALETSMAKWVKTVKPIETLEFNADRLIPTILEGIYRLRNRSIEPTMLCGHPQLIGEVLTMPEVIHLKSGDPNARLYMKLMGFPTRLFGNMFVNYSDGLYLFSDQSALLYHTDKMDAYWNVPPITVHLERKHDDTNE